jgi:hypothetical protein
MKIMIYLGTAIPGAVVIYCIGKLIGIPDLPIKYLQIPCILFQVICTILFIYYAAKNKI